MREEHQKCDSPKNSASKYLRLTLPQNTPWRRSCRQPEFTVGAISDLVQGRIVTDTDLADLLAHQQNQRSSRRRHGHAVTERGPTDESPHDDIGIADEWEDGPRVAEETL